MDSRISDDVDHLSDDEIFEIVGAVGEQEGAAELFAAQGITVPLYCLWKSKYRHLSLAEFRETRRQEFRRARWRIAALLAVVIVGGGGIVFALARAVQQSPAGASATQSTVPSQAPAAPATPPVERDPRLDVPSPTIVAPDAEPGYKIQVAAAPTVDEARVIVERLTSKGHAAYLYQAIIGGQEVFRVRVGPFDTLPAAQNIASQLHSAGYTDAWITR